MPTYGPLFSMPVLVLDSKGYAENGHPAGAASTVKAAARAATGKAIFVYAPTPALQARVVQDYAQALAKINPTAAQGVAAGFGPGKTDYGTVFHNIVQGSGLHDADAADAMTAFLVLAHQIVNDPAGRRTIAPAVARGVRAQVIAKVGAAATTPAAVAELGEAMKLRTVLLYAGWLGAEQQQVLPGFSQSVARLVKQQYAMDLSQYQLSAAGLSRK